MRSFSFILNSAAGLFFVFEKGETRIQDKGVARIIKRWATLAIPNDHLVLTHNMAQEGSSHCWLLGWLKSCWITRKILHKFLLLSTEAACVEKQGSILPLAESQLKQEEGGRCRLSRKSGFALLKGSGCRQYDARGMTKMCKSCSIQID